MLREHRSFSVEDLVVDTELLENARDAGYANRCRLAQFPSLMSNP